MTMTYNNKTMKMTLLTLLALSIAIPTTSMVFAKQVYTAEQVDAALKTVQPYVEIDNEKIGKIDIQTAKKNGVDSEILQIATEFLKSQNNMIQRIHDNPNQRMYVDDVDFDKFQDYRKSIQEGKMRGDNPVEILGMQSAYAADVCGGSGDNPHPEPTVTYSGSYASKTAAINALPGTFYKVPAYASGLYGDDYHDPKTLYSCTTDSFRYQTVIGQNGSTWRHVNQHSPGEPNPEVLAYTWPVWWWGGYVAEWHIEN